MGLELQFSMSRIHICIVPLSIDFLYQYALCILMESPSLSQRKSLWRKVGKMPSLIVFSSYMSDFPSIQTILYLLEQVY